MGSSEKASYTFIKISLFRGSSFTQKNRQGLSHETAFLNKTTDSSYGIFLECQDE